MKKLPIFFEEPIRRDVCDDDYDGRDGDDEEEEEEDDGDDGGEEHEDGQMSKKSTLTSDVVVRTKLERCNKPSFEIIFNLSNNCY